jgi:hypothetical protein
MEKHVMVWRLVLLRMLFLRPVPALYMTSSINAGVHGSYFYAKMINFL